MLIDCAGKLYHGTLIRASTAVILYLSVRSKALAYSTSGTVIPLLKIVAPPTTHVRQLLWVPYQLATLDSEVDFQ